MSHLSRLACDLSWRHAGPSGPPWRVQVNEYSRPACRALAMVELSCQGGWWGITAATERKANKVVQSVLAKMSKSVSKRRAA